MKYQLVALISNVDDSVVGLRFGEGITLQKWPLEKLLDILKEVDDIPEYEIISRVADQYYATAEVEQFAYVLVAEFEVTKEDLAYPPGKTQFDSAWAHRQAEIARRISEKLQLMRLFAEGNVDVPAIYFFRDEEGQLTYSSSHVRVAAVPFNPYRIERQELARLQEFLDEWQLPFPADYVQLAFENFDESFSAHSTKTAYLLLTIALEALFNPGAHELRYRISRGVAVLLGETRDRSIELFRAVRDCYDARSKLVHAGSSAHVADSDVRRLRQIVRDCVIRVAQVGVPKEELDARLTAAGFGSQPFDPERPRAIARSGADSA